ncbi:MAG: division/cell wall cluster transcriptional repressor MraZ [Flavobacteriales bacterium]|nr:division/cell wall cluster transcriptional repressor MraZ [Flavobacteriales bacterium]MDW8432324.1 division/cell wall cluster transcriptional repressor MraZ [Flavobacteriales bacterium]
MALSLIGEYDCRLDSKGRFMFPAPLRKQLGPEFEKGFVVNRNLHQRCLVLHTMEGWAALNKKLARLNRLIKQDDILVRRVTGGATPVEPDATGRILIPKSLADYAGLNGDIKVVGSNDIMEVWDKKTYEDFMSADFDFEKLALEVLGKLDNAPDVS